jgi:hypothetical protein
MPVVGEGVDGRTPIRKTLIVAWMERVAEEPSSEKELVEGEFDPIVAVRSPSQQKVL